MIIILLTAVAGGVGAAARFSLDVTLSRRADHGWVRLLVINASGSAVLGLLAGLASSLGMLLASVAAAGIGLAIGLAL